MQRPVAAAITLILTACSSALSPVNRLQASRWFGSSLS